MKIIITADDLGITKEHTLGIVYALKNNLCSNASLMVNTEFSDYAVGLISELFQREEVDGKIQLHLTFTHGKPLSEDIKKINLFYDNENKKFRYRNAFGLKQWLIPRYIKEIRYEIEAQIKKIVSYGFQLSHIDSHHCIHETLSFVIALRPLLKKYNIKTVRPPKIEPNYSFKMKFMKCFVSFIYQIILPNNLCYSSRIKYASGFLCDKNKKQKCIEVFCHPRMENGVCIDDYTKDTDLNRNYTLEESVELLNCFGEYECVSYYDYHHMINDNKAM